MLFQVVLAPRKEEDLYSSEDEKPQPKPVVKLLAVRSVNHPDVLCFDWLNVLVAPIQIQVDENQQFQKIIGDPAHPVSEGYLCQKATRLNYYQEQVRLKSPLRRKADGSFEEISWETAIKEIAQKLKTIRDTHGGKTIAFAGGGGQGNHLGGIYGAGLRAVCRLLR